MNVPVSIREVAAHAGVSVATVSNVINRPEIVAPQTRDRVQAAITELGFVRNESARQLRAGRSRTIGLVVLDVANPFFTDVARGVEDEANKAGLAVILCNSDDQARKENRYLDVLEEHRVHGVLITPVVGASTRLASLQLRGTPVVLVDSRSPSRGQCSVAVDDVMGGDLAMSHLLAAGHERIAYVAGPASIRQVADRHEGALRALAPGRRGGRRPHGHQDRRAERLRRAAGGRVDRGDARVVPADRRVLRQRPDGAGRAAGDDPQPHPGAGRHLDHRLRRHRLRGGRRRPADLRPPAPAGTRPHRRPAAPRGGGRRRDPPPPPGDLRARAGRPPVHRANPPP